MRNTLRRRWYAVLGIAGLLAVGTAGPGLADDTAAAARADVKTPEKAVLTGMPGRTVAGVEQAGAVEIRTGNGTKKLLAAPEPGAGARFGASVVETATAWAYPYTSPSWARQV